MNEQNFQTLVYFIQERHNIFLKRQRGEDPPWSTDPIFREWKFCNIFRKNDYQTIKLKEILKEHSEADSADLLFNIFQFRAFNLNTTYEVLGWHDQQRPFNFKGSLIKLDKLALDNQRIFSGAYMLRGREGISKQESVCLTLENIWQKRNALITEIESYEPSLESAWNVFMRQDFWGWGPFTYYQIVLDMLDADLIKSPRDINTWTCMGPGADRGFNLIFPGENIWQWPQLLPSLLRDVNFTLPEDFPKLNLQDLEFCLCEIFKYHRILHGGRGKERFHARI